MAKINKNYSNGEITVVWQPDLCIHSTKCFKGLSAVFNPQQRPWINMEAASTEEIRKQVEQCPSGALSFIMNNERKVMAESMVSIDVSDNGPYIIRGPANIKYKGKEELRDSGTIALCRCGGSSNKPYCDGTHRKVEFKG